MCFSVIVFSCVLLFRLELNKQYVLSHLYKIMLYTVNMLRLIYAIHEQFRVL